MSENVLAHYGVLGMKWGVRRYQNEDGTLTSAGKKRYSDNGGDLKKAALKKVNEVANKGTQKAVHETRMKTDPNYAARNKTQPWNEKTSNNQAWDEKPAKSVTSQKQRSRMSDAELAKKIQRLEKETKLKDLEQKNRDKGRVYAEEILKDVGKRVITTAATGAILYGGKVIVSGKFDADALANAIFNGGSKKK